MDSTPKRQGAPRTPAFLGGSAIFSEPVYVTRALAPDRRVFAERVAAIFRSRWFTNDGPTVRELERRLTETLGVEFCAAFANGTVALQAALRSLDLSGEVITTPFTFPATLHAVVMNGLTPVFCDIDSDTYNLDPVRAAELVGGSTSALLPVHVFGSPCDVEALAELGERRGLRVVYDAAHAFGVSVRGRPIGCFGDLSVLSFHATKVFHTSEGGAVVGVRREAFGRLAMLRNFGIVSEDEVTGVGVNGKMSEVHAAMGLALLEEAHAEVGRRAAIAARYRERLSELPGVVFQRFAPETLRNHYNFSLEIDEAAFGLSRDAVHEALRAENVHTRKYFHPLCSENPSYRDLPSARPEHLRNAHRVASRILCIPLYGELGLEGADRVADALFAIQAHAPAIRRCATGA
jgi:dTDP-4-amino-4,6-dideoxygalactose transaminase